MSSLGYPNEAINSSPGVLDAGGTGMASTTSSVFVSDFIIEPSDHHHQHHRIPNSDNLTHRRLSSTSSELPSSIVMNPSRLTRSPTFSLIEQPSSQQQQQQQQQYPDSRSISSNSNQRQASSRENKSARFVTVDPVQSKSNAFVQAMKALQEKVKMLEECNEHLIRETQELSLERNSLHERLTQAIEENAKLKECESQLRQDRIQYEREDQSQRQRTRLEFEETKRVLDDELKRCEFERSTFERSLLATNAKLDACEKQLFDYAKQTAIEKRHTGQLADMQEQIALLKKENDRLFLDSKYAQEQIVEFQRMKYNHFEEVDHLQRQLSEAKSVSKPQSYRQSQQSYQPQPTPTNDINRVMQQAVPKANQFHETIDHNLNHSNTYLQKQPQQSSSQWQRPMDKSTNYSFWERTHGDGFELNRTSSIPVGERTYGKKSEGMMSQPSKNASGSSHQNIYYEQNSKSNLSENQSTHGMSRNNEEIVDEIKQRYSARKLPLVTSSENNQQSLVRVHQRGGKQSPDRIVVKPFNEYEHTRRSLYSISKRPQEIIMENIEDECRPTDGNSHWSAEANVHDGRNEERHVSCVDVPAGASSLTVPGGDEREPEWKRELEVRAISDEIDGVISMILQIENDITHLTMTKASLEADVQEFASDETYGDMARLRIATIWDQVRSKQDALAYLQRREKELLEKMRFRK